MKKEERSIYRQISGKKLIAFAIIPFVVLTAMILFLFSPVGQSSLNSGVPVPEVTIEKIEFQEGKIVAFIRNTGPVDITVAQADINDRIHPAAIEPSRSLPRLTEAQVIIPFPWNPAEPYEVGITTSDGVRFSKNVEAAAEVLTPNVEQVLLFAVIGAYVGIIPIMIGLLWYPFIRRLNTNKYNFFLSLTAGLLVFLGIDAVLESNEIISENVAAIFNGQVLIVMVVIVSFLVLLYTSETLTQRAAKKSVSANYSTSSLSSSASTTSQQQELIKPLAISLMIAIGIGLHNFGEGLAISAAVLLGKAALSTFLIVGFTLHNTTEGLAIVAPVAKSGQVMIRKLIVMGFIAGAPTIAGAWIGGFLYSPLAAIIFLSVGAGAIFQVVYSIASWISHTSSQNRKTLINTSTIAGFAIGMLIMYTTGLLI
ncbi:MAG TPA: divalent cation transporter [Nitrososphaeraceae archaeon]|nr:divalent cation transporter [Nitrososphaeraceae archaeon]HEX6028291.1 divalent cation transporter [Nitrososphaeraceae archaeon]